MKINHDRKLPIPFVIVDDFFTDDELELIWKEIDFLSDKDKLLKPKDTSSAHDENGKLKKSNLGIFVDDVYCQRETSNILKITRKLFDKNFMDDLIKNNYIFNFYQRATSDRTLLSYYGDKDYYKSHHDDADFTSIIWLYKEPKEFEGGEFKFTDYDIKFECKNNQLIIFPSDLLHEVSEIELKSKKPWTGRYSLVNFAYQRGQV